tara:strand:+ start:173 stop:541 length:369 start_codon:yes stop_codon:yes gene_type:complete
MGDLTKNFSRSEFKCQGVGCCDKSKEIDIGIVSILQVLRDFFGETVKVTSAIRCDTHNANVGGAKRSKHLAGIACDIVVSNHTPSEVYDFLCYIMRDYGGIIQYKSFVHVDIRATMYRSERA